MTRTTLAAIAFTAVSATSAAASCGDAYPPLNSLPLGAANAEFTGARTRGFSPTVEDPARPLASNEKIVVVAGEKFTVKPYPQDESAPKSRCGGPTPVADFTLTLSPESVTALQKARADNGVRTAIVTLPGFKPDAVCPRFTQDAPHFAFRVVTTPQAGYQHAIAPAQPKERNAIRVRDAKAIETARCVALDYRLKP